MTQLTILEHYNYEDPFDVIDGKHAECLPSHLLADFFTYIQCRHVIELCMLLLMFHTIAIAQMQHLTVV